MQHGKEEERLRILADVLVVEFLLGLVVLTADHGNGSHGKGEPTNELVQLEYNEIKQAIDFDRTEAAHSYFDLLKPGIFKRVWLGVSLQICKQDFVLLSQ